MDTSVNVWEEIVPVAHLNRQLLSVCQKRLWTVTESCQDVRIVTNCHVELSRCENSYELSQRVVKM